MIKTLIADDERHALDRLKNLLANDSRFELVAEATSGTEALEMIIKLQPQVVFLDINMPGLSVFQSLPSLAQPPLVVFQTAHSQYAAEAFELNALDYLLKPVSAERFAQAVGKILVRLNLIPAKPSPESQRLPEPVASPERPDKLSLKVGNRIQLIEVTQISKILFEDGLSFFYCPQGRLLSDRSLNHYEDLLHTQGFFRCSRSALVNLTFVVSIHQGFKGRAYLELRDGSKIEVSRRKALALKKTLAF